MTTYPYANNGFIARIEGEMVASSILVEPKLPQGVADCDGLPRCQWITKSVLLKEDDGEFLDIGVYHSVCPKFVDGNEGLLGPNKVAV